MSEWDLPQQAHVPVETNIWVWCYGGNQVVLYCGLMTASVCVGSVVPWERFPYRPRLATAWQELLLQMFASCAGSGGKWER